MYWTETYANTESLLLANMHTELTHAVFMAAFDFLCILNKRALCLEVEPFIFE